MIMWWLKLEQVFCVMCQYVEKKEEDAFSAPHIDTITNSRYVYFFYYTALQFNKMMYVYVTEMNTKSNLIEIYGKFNKILSLSWYLNLIKIYFPTDWTFLCFTRIIQNHIYFYVSHPGIAYQKISQIDQ